MLNIKVLVTGLDENIERLNKLGEIIGDFSQELNEMGMYLMEFYTYEVYETEGAVYGTPWAPLSETYAEEKRKKWGDTTILIASGLMKDSNVMSVEPLHMEIQNTTDYAQYHQEGTDKMPQRILMQIDEERSVEMMVKFAEVFGERLSDI